MTTLFMPPQREVWTAVHATCPEERWLAVHQLPLAVGRDTVLRPDVVAIGIEHVTAESVPVQGAVLAIDVVAEAWEAEDHAAKAEIYASAGCVYWRVDLLRDAIAVNGVTGHFATSEPWPIAVDLAGLTAWRDQLLGRSKAAE